MAGTTQQTCPDCDCDDSALSILANILGILTFALGLAAYFVAFAAVTRGAARDEENMRNALHMIRRQINQTQDFLDTLNYRADPDLEMMKELIAHSLQSFKDAKVEFQSLLTKFRSDNKGSGCEPDGEESDCELPGLSFSSRIKWWYYENNMNTGLAKLRESQQQYAAVQLTFLERKLKTQSDDISALHRRAENPD